MTLLVTHYMYSRPDRDAIPQTTPFQTGHYTSIIGGLRPGMLFRGCTPEEALLMTRRFNIFDESSGYLYWPAPAVEVAP
jgi:hypothetical protein